MDLVRSDGGGRQLTSIYANSLKIWPPVIKACLLDPFVLTDKILSFISYVVVNLKFKTDHMVAIFKKNHF